MDKVLALIKKAEKKITRLQKTLFLFYNKNIHIKPNCLYKVDSSIFTIEDCLYSFSEFIERTGKHHNLYLNAYGILNMLYTQSDALDSLHKSIGINYNHNDDLKKIRDIRSLSVGHPTNTYSENKKCTSIISRHTMKNESFSFLVYFEDGETKFVECNLIDLINTQLLHLNDLTDKLLSNIHEKTAKTLSKLPKHFFKSKLEDLCIDNNIRDLLYKSKPKNLYIKRIIVNLNKFKALLQENHFLSDSSEELINTTCDFLEEFAMNTNKSLKMEIFTLSAHIKKIAEETDQYIDDINNKAK